MAQDTEPRYHDHGQGPAHVAHQDPDMAGLLELEGEVFSAYHLEVAGWLRQLSDGLDVRRIVDLGSGPGVGTLTLATAFAKADVVAVDLSAELLTRVRSKAAEAGLANRIFTVQADLDQGLPHVGSPDLAWASLSLHHLRDPDRLLRDLRSSLNPGGLVAVAELASPLRLLPDDLGVGRSGLEDRVDQVTAQRHAESLPHLNDDWAERLRRVGFHLVAQRTFSTHLDPPTSETVGRFARIWLQRARRHAEGLLDAGDLKTLDNLTADHGADSVLRRTDLKVHESRTVWVASAGPGAAPGGVVPRG